MVDFSIRGDAGVMAELRKVVRKKTEVEVLPVVDLSGKSAFHFFLWAIQHHTQEEVSDVITTLGLIKLLFFSYVF